MRNTLIRPLASAILIAICFSVAPPTTAADFEWINSAEAYFATPRERAEWFRLSDAMQRERFQKRYWQMRDPTPETDRNEFYDVISERIRRADAKFAISGGHIGSLTGQGMLYVVFGPPSRVRTNYRTDPDERMSERTQQEATWIYDQDRTPRLLEMLGRPALEVVIMIEPFRRIDSIQTPGMVAHYREVLAERSVVNRQMDVPIASSPIEVSVARLDAPLPDNARAALRSSRQHASGRPPLSVGDIVTAEGSTALVTISLPNAGDDTTHLTTFAEIRQGDRVAATIAEPFVTTRGVDAAPGSRSTVLRLDLRPGSYEGSFAVVDDRSGETLLAVITPIRVFDPLADFALSSIIVGTRFTSGENNIFTFGTVALHPRADRRFAAAESLWYFATIRSRTGVEGLTANMHLRRDGKPLAASAFRPQIVNIAADTFLFASELPLAKYPPGKYTLYLTAAVPGQEPEVRRTDFEIVP